MCLNHLFVPIMLSEVVKFQRYFDCNLFSRDSFSSRLKANHINDWVFILPGQHNVFHWDAQFCFVVVVSFNLKYFYQFFENFMHCFLMIFILSHTVTTPIPYPPNVVSSFIVLFSSWCPVGAVYILLELVRSTSGYTFKENKLSLSQMLSIMNSYPARGRTSCPLSSFFAWLLQVLCTLSQPLLCQMYSYFIVSGEELL